MSNTTSGGGNSTSTKPNAATRCLDAKGHSDRADTRKFFGWGTISAEISVLRWHQDAMANRIDVSSVHGRYPVYTSFSPKTHKSDSVIECHTECLLTVRYFLLTNIAKLFSLRIICELPWLILYIAQVAILLSCEPSPSSLYSGLPLNSKSYSNCCIIRELTALRRMF